jgi:hypothetical protein
VVGTRTIRVLRLDDPDLERDRQGAQEKIHRIYFSKYADPNATEQEIADSIDAFNSGREAYSVAALDYLSVKRAKLARQYL